MNTESPQSSRILLLAVLCSLLMMGMGTGLVLWNDVRQKNSDVALGKKIIADFQKNNEPKIQAFIGNLQTFAKSNPDFAPILAKYGISAATVAPAKK